MFDSEAPDGCRSNGPLSPYECVWWFECVSFYRSEQPLRQSCRNRLRAGEGCVSIRKLGSMPCTPSVRNRRSGDVRSFAVTGPERTHGLQGPLSQDRCG